MKKYTKRISVVVIFVVFGLAYYFYLSYQSQEKLSAEKTVTDKELAAITTKDLEKDYPESPKGVVELYAKITKAYYKKGISDEQIENLGRQARLLFDNELKAKQTDDEFIESLKVDIALYNSFDRYINDFKVDSAANFKYMTVDSKEYAVGLAVYYVREGKKLSPSYQSYKLRKNGNGRWKILYWDLENENLMED